MASNLASGACECVHGVLAMIHIRDGAISTYVIISRTNVFLSHIYVILSHTPEHIRSAVKYVTALMKCVKCGNDTPHKHSDFLVCVCALVCLCVSVCLHCRARDFVAARAGAFKQRESTG